MSSRFVHERGFRTAVFNLGVLGGINLAVPIGESRKIAIRRDTDPYSLIAAAIIQYGSYHIAMYGMGGAFALTLIMIFFWMPESAYAREALNIDTGNEKVGRGRKHSDILKLIIIDYYGRQSKIATSRARTYHQRTA